MMLLAGNPRKFRHDRTLAILAERIMADVRQIGMRFQNRRIRTFIATFTAAASFAAFAACGNQDANDQTTASPDDSGSASTATGAPIVGSRWILSTLDTTGEPIEATDVADAYFQIGDDGQVLGSTGCNGFGGSAEVGEGTITFSSVIATQKACSGDLGQIDRAILGVLHGEVTVEVSGDVLTVTSPDDETLTLEVAEEPSATAS